MKLLTTVSNTTCLVLLLLSVLLTSTTTMVTAAADNRYCYSIIGSPLNEKLKHTTNMTQLGLNIANSYNPGINYQDYQSIYAYKAEYPRLYPLLNCHLKVTPNNSRPGWVHDFSDTLNVGLKKLTKYEFETFRGTGLDNIPKLGDLLQNSGFLSTSKSAQVASAFASSRFLFRFSKSGGRDITGVQGLPFQGELEVIIPPGKCFRVVAFGNQSKWWSDMGPVIVNEYNVNITFIDLMKVKCPKDGKNYFEDTNNDVLSMPTSWELAQFEKSVSRSRFSYESRAIPSEWRCASTSYNTSDGCDCNCGAYDPDCNLPGSSLFGCPSSGAYFCSATNGTCTRVISKYGPVPEQWKCLPNYYGDGVCNCECGYPDPDCQNQNLNSFAYGCLVNQYCNTNGKCQDKKYVPPQWTCSPQYYGSGDGCDCGCGSVLDPDCLDPNQEILNCPCTNMNCTLGYCTGECMGINLLASTTVAPTPGGNDDNKGGEGKVVLVYEGVGVFVASIIASFLGGSFITMFVMIGLYFLITHFKKRKANKLGTNPDLNHQFIQMHNN